MLTVCVLQTTATGMSWFLMCMAQHPEVQARCREEVLHHLPSPATPVTWEVLDNLHYLGLTIKETLRFLLLFFIPVSTNVAGVVFILQ